MFKYTAKTVAPFFKRKGQMSIPDLLSITVDAAFGNQAWISPLLVMVNTILLLEATLCSASSFQRPCIQHCRKITVNRPSINGAFH